MWIKIRRRIRFILSLLFFVLSIITFCFSIVSCSEKDFVGDSIGQIENHKPPKYYKMDHLYMAFNKGGEYYNATSFGPKDFDKFEIFDTEIYGNSHEFIVHYLLPLTLEDLEIPESYIYCSSQFPCKNMKSFKYLGYYRGIDFTGCEYLEDITIKLPEEEVLRMLMSAKQTSDYTEVQRYYHLPRLEQAENIKYL